MNIEITCNTDDAVLLANVQTNSRLPLRWVKSLPAHDGHAIIVGGGPSLSDYLPTIRKRIELGQKVFALNGAAKFLNRHGIIPDYQVMLDARPENIGLLGEAKEYLLASQCDPALVEAVSPVTLWHAIDGDDNKVPDEDYDDSYALIGGGTVVGLSSMALVYTLGYRKLHLFGYDSSHRETEGHAYAQPLNAKDPVCKVTVGGKTFTSSLAMAAQAERFPDVCNNLIDAGCVITVDADGLIMAVVEEMRRQPPELTEDEKYRQMWSLPSYRTMSPGENFAEEAVQVCNITTDTKVIDFGCGTGRGGQEIHVLTGAPVHLVDFAANCLDPDVTLPLSICDLTKPMFLRGDLGFCTDVMEHIPPEQVSAVIDNIMACVDRCFFKIARFPDHMGALIGQSLHLSVFDAAWWEENFTAYDIVYRDHDKDGAFPYTTLYVRNPLRGT